MSKVVKSIGRAIGKVVKGVAKIAKKIIKSPIGKLVAGAALAFFGVPAVTGFFGGAAGAGASGLTGALNGISGAWSGLTGAATSLAAGNLGEAASQIATGFTGGSSAGGSGLVGGAMSPTEQTFAKLAGDAAGAGTASMGSAAAGGATTPVSQGLVGKLLSSPYAAPALIQAGSQIVSGIGQGKMIEAQNERQDRLAEEERQRYNTNVGARLFTT